MNWSAVGHDLLYGGFDLFATVFLILVPLMIFVEWAQTRGWVEKLAVRLGHYLRWLGVTPGAVLPILAGTAFGITYGAGVLIAEVEANRTSPREVAITSLYLSTSHSVFEDTLLFVAVGANGWILLGVRLVAALIMLALFSRVVFRMPETAFAT